MKDNLGTKFAILIVSIIVGIACMGNAESKVEHITDPVIIADELPTIPDEDTIEIKEEHINEGNLNLPPNIKDEYEIIEVLPEGEYHHECEYEVAHQIWDYCTEELGLNFWTTAGIIGNMMAETGGQTLDIKVVYWSKYASPGEYYGICQWSRSRGKDIWGKGLEEQLELLKKELKYEFNTYGQNYRKGFNYTQFTELVDAREAALAFAKCYERCASGSYAKRQRNAEIAFEHFVIYTVKE